MAFKKHNRQYDMVVFGATGYTGQLIAEYIATNLPTNLKWAVSGRSEQKLQTLIDECKKLNPNRPSPAIETADVNDDIQMGALAEKTFLMITAVGPYCQFGEHAVKACAQAGTHYLDVTGEVPWVHLMIKKYEETAKASGAIMIPQVGMESAPADLCTWTLASCLRKELGAKTKDVTFILYDIKSAPSGGTIATVLSLWEHFTMDEMRNSHSPFALSPIPHPEEPKRPHQSIPQLVLGAHHVPNIGLVTTSFFGTSNRGEVERSWGLLSQIPNRKDEFYGPKFHWAEYYKVRNWLYGIAVHWALVLGTILLVFVPPVRTLAKRFVTAPGQGPSREDMKKEQVEYRAIANPDLDTPTNKQAVLRARFQGSMYYMTAVFSAQAAMTLLEDDVGLGGGFYTPCCLGQALIDRADDAGFKMEVKIQEK